MKWKVFGQNGSVSIEEIPTREKDCFESVQVAVTKCHRIVAGKQQEFLTILEAESRIGLSSEVLPGCRLLSLPPFFIRALMFLRASPSCSNYLPKRASFLHVRNSGNLGRTYYISSMMAFLAVLTPACLDSKKYSDTKHYSDTSPSVLL